LRAVRRQAQPSAQLARSQKLVARSKRLPDLDAREFVAIAYLIALLTLTAVCSS